MFCSNRGDDTVAVFRVLRGGDEGGEQAQCEVMLVRLLRHNGQLEQRVAAKTEGGGARPAGVSGAGAVR